MAVVTTGYQVFPLTAVAVGPLNPPAIAQLFMNDAFLKVEGTWPMVAAPSIDGPSVEKIVNPAGTSKFQLPFLKFTGVSGGVDNYTVNVGGKEVKILQLAPRITLPSRGPSVSISKERLASAINGLRNPDEIDFWGEHNNLLTRTTKQIRRLVTKETVPADLLGLFSLVLDNGWLQNVYYEDQHEDPPALLIRPIASEAWLNSARILTGLAKEGRLVLLEPASVDLFSREMKEALGPYSNRPLVSVQSKENPHGALLRGAIGVYTPEGVTIGNLNAPFMAIIGNVIPEGFEPRMVELDRPPSFNF